ncbi:patatin-like phospholipase family protein [Limnobacter sp. P1]|uniref:patatin-like phospholipase family protein n=1 Tax=Limnobacter olei TaxID=3031298 RepID=UPI0023AF9ECF|nr:patatin-like phospholipase family protein [Limnobacter sp. P1]
MSVLAGATLVLCACQTVGAFVRPQSHEPNTTVEQEPWFSSKQVDETRKIQSGFVLVLSGGGARGFAHIGVLKALEEHGLEPSLVVGTSAGAVVAAYWGLGYTADQMLDRARQLRNSDLFAPVLPSFGQPLLPGELGLFSGQALESQLRLDFGTQLIERLKRPVAIVATDLESGKPVVFNAGDVARAVRASSTIPGFFTPPSIQGRMYIDGQASSPLPILPAQQLSNLPIVAVDVVYPPALAEVKTLSDLLFQTFLISSFRIKELEMPQAEVLISPQLNNVGQLGLRDLDWVYQSGYRIAAANINKVSAAVHGNRLQVPVIVGSSRE